MGVVTFASVRSCGTTTLAVALAATWPAGRRVVLVELDPAGGTLAASSGWASEPSLVSLAAATRRSSDPEAIWAHCHHLAGGAAVLAAPAGSDQTRGAIRMLGELLSRLSDVDADVLVDAGRLDPAAPLTGVAAAASRVVLCVRPRLPDLHALATFLDAGPGAGPLQAGRLALVVVGDGPYPDTESAQALAVEVLGRLPWDPGAAELLATVPATDRRLRLSPSVRAARSLATALAAAEAAPVPGGAPASGHEEVPPLGRPKGRRLPRPFRISSIAGTAGVHGDEDPGGAGIAAGSTDGAGALGTGAVVNGRLLNGSAPGGGAVR